MNIKMKEKNKIIFLYNSFLFKYVFFESDNNSLISKQIISVLNCKNRRKKIEHIYDYGYDYIADFYKNKNICKFKNGICIAHRLSGKVIRNGCCRKCEYNSCGVCPTKNIACKLFYCECSKKKI